MVIEKARNGDIELAYESFGSPDGSPLLLLNGSAAQMGMWPEEFCAALVDRGYRAARMDYRDKGLSTRLCQYDGVRRRRGQPPVYTLRDVADDVVAVIDALGWSSAHLVGTSLGAMVGEEVAAHHPDWVRSLTLLSAGPIRPLANRSNLSAMLKGYLVMRRKVHDRDGEGRRLVDLNRIIGSRGIHWTYGTGWRQGGQPMTEVPLRTRKASGSSPRSLPRPTGAAHSPRSRHRPWSSTAKRTQWLRSGPAGTSPTPSPARGSSPIPAWGTTCRGHCGRPFGRGRPGDRAAAG